MKKFYLFAFALLIAMMTACTSGNELIDDENLGSGDEYVTVEVSLQPKTRSIGIDNEAGADGDFDYQFDGTAQPFFVLFKHSSLGSVVVETTITIPEGYTYVPNTNNDPNYVPNTFSVKIPKPASYANVSSNYQIAGAIGIDRMLPDGTCEIKPNTEITANGKYKVPFYFPLTTVTNDKAKFHLNNYGSLLRVVFHAKEGEAQSTFSSLYLKTSVIATTGTFNINTSSVPTFTHTSTGVTEAVSTNADGSNRIDYTYITGDTYTLKNVVATPATPAVIYIWGYPMTDVPATSTNGLENAKRTVQLQTSYGSNNFYYQNLSKVKWETGKTYTMNINFKEPSLMFLGLVDGYTEFDCYYEIYNPTSGPVDLNNYWLYDPMMARWVDLGETDPNILKTQSRGGYAPDDYTLPSNKSLVVQAHSLNNYKEADSKLYWANETMGFLKYIPMTLSNYNVYFGVFPNYATNYFLVL